MSSCELPRVVGLPSPRKPIGSFLHRLESPRKPATPVKSTPTKATPTAATPTAATPTKITPIKLTPAQNTQIQLSIETTPVVTPLQQATPIQCSSIPTASSKIEDTPTNTLSNKAAAAVTEATPTQSSSNKPAAAESAPSVGRRLRSTVVRNEDLSTQDFIPIVTQSRHRQPLTEHQKEMRRKKRSVKLISLASENSSLILQHIL